MRRFLVAVLAVVAGLTYLSTAVADDSPRTIVEKGLKSMGGEAFQARPFAVHFKMRGKVPLGAGAKDDFPFTGEVFTQPNSDFRYAFDLDANSATINITMSLVGNKGWRSVGGMLEAVDEASLEEMKIGRYYDQVTSLAPLLNDRSFTLASLGEVKVQGATAVGVQVSSKGQPDIKIFFDKNSGLMIKTEYRAKSSGEREMLHESYYSDWREPDHTQADLEILRAAKIQVDDAKVMDYLRKHIPAAGDGSRIKVLINQLGDDMFEARVKATKELVEIGAAAVPLLREAAESSDPEVKKRAEQCLKEIGSIPDEKVLAAALRLTGWRKPKGAPELLLDWAARSGDDFVGREARSALAAVAVVNGKPDGALTKALEDKDLGRRSAAAAALEKDGGLADQKPGRRLYITGVKFPMKATQFQNSAKMLEREYTAIEFFNRFDEKVFAKPK
jgi:hypothetical protein